MSSILFYSTRKKISKKLHTRKNGPSGAPGPASTSPWRAKRGTLPKLPTFLSQLKGDHSEKKQIFEKNLNAEKLKGGPFGNFKHPICCKTSKKLMGRPFGEKNFFRKIVSQCRKTERGTLWGFSTSILLQNIKKLKERKFFIFGKKSQSSEKN